MNKKSSLITKNKSEKNQKIHVDQKLSSRNIEN
jgi:hypothetical protein